MMCDPCKHAGLFLAVAKVTPLIISRDMMILEAENHHARCEQLKTCPCAHKTTTSAINEGQPT